MMSIIIRGKPTTVSPLCEVAVNTIKRDADIIKAMVRQMRYLPRRLRLVFNIDLSKKTLPLIYLKRLYNKPRKKASADYALAKRFTTC
jgi:hypothetical protein